MYCNGFVSRKVQIFENGIMKIVRDFLALMEAASS
jgi:hypothetical protein